MPKKKPPPANHPEKDRAPLPESRSVSQPFPVVGIAASAGGLDAFKALLSTMPGDTGMAFVLIPHLDPSHSSLMVELLRPHTQMPVHEAEEGVKIHADAEMSLAKIEGVQQVHSPQTIDF